jgi:hypothetical protein
VPDPAHQILRCRARHPGGERVRQVPKVVRVEVAGAPADGRWTVTLITGEVIDVRSDADNRIEQTLYDAYTG